MAPGILTSSSPTAPHNLFSKPLTNTKIRDNNNAPRSIFPDGIRTSGQHDPIYEQLQPYSAFPKKISGPTVWETEKYRQNPESWTHRFTKEEIRELGETADAFMGGKTELTGISQDNFPLPNLSKVLLDLRKDLIDGKGFILFKGFPTAEWGLHKSAVAYMGLGTWLGYFVSQNAHGHVLGHVKDVGDDPNQIDRIRIYRTSARQFFHADDCDIVGLLCVARSLEGGESDIASVHEVFNILQTECPDVVETLTKPIWYFSRRLETGEGQREWTVQPVIYVEPVSDEDKQAGKEGRVYCKWDPYFVKSLESRWKAGEVPEPTPEMREAMQVLEETCQRVALHMVLEVGDIQFLSNSQVLHARTAYKDYAPSTGKPRRHLMRLWLATPSSEGGWTLPFHDTAEKKRGGIQVNDNRPHCPLDAE